MRCISASLPRRMSLLVVGSIAFDALKSPFGERERTLGGSAVHFSLAASYFTDVRVVGPVGDDFGAAEYEVLHSHGVNTDDVEHVEGGQTFFWAGEYEWNVSVRHTLDTQLNVFGDFQPKLSEESKAADTVFLANIQPDLQREVREECADVRQLMELGPRIVVVKQGEYGAALFSDEDDGFFALPAYPLETVVDPTGAGDSFAGGLLGYLDSQGGATDRATVRRAMTYGSAVASYWVEEFGCERAQRLTREEIDERYEAFRRMTSIEGVAAR